MNRQLCRAAHVVVVTDDRPRRPGNVVVATVPTVVEPPQAIVTTARTVGRTTGPPAHTTNVIGPSEHVVVTMDRPPFVEDGAVFIEASPAVRTNRIAGPTTKRRCRTTSRAIVTTKATYLTNDDMSLEDHVVGPDTHVVCQGNDAVFAKRGTICAHSHAAFSTNRRPSEKVVVGRRSARTARRSKCAPAWRCSRRPARRGPSRPRAGSRVDDERPFEDTRRACVRVAGDGRGIGPWKEDAQRVAARW
jgi:hypothetical protein